MGGKQRMSFEVTFPCGYSLKMNNSFFELLAGGGVTLGEAPESCPLHGTNCKSQKEES